jgi:tetratricopeptide (TPR) repeat protein
MLIRGRLEHLGENTVVELLAALVTPERREQIDAHTAVCPTCRRLISELVRRTATQPAFATGSPGAAAPRVHVAGTTVDRYVLGARLGSGATGTVVEAHDPELDRTVALKLLHSGLAQRERIQREARALAKLSHPNVVAVHDAGSYDGELFVAMEKVDGTDLRAWLAAQRSVSEILDAFRQIGSGLAAAHAAGIVHRDIKPENILVGNDGRVRVADFGLAGGADGAPDFIGTPAYMAPEQFEDGIASMASDQFAYCVSLYEALYGKRPFPINLVEEVTAGLPLDAGLRVPRGVRSVLARGLAADPKARFPSMAALVDALRPRRTKRAAIAATVAALAIGGIGFAAARIDRGDGAVCSDAAGDLAAVWNPVREAAMHARFATTGLPYAEGAWRAVDRSIERFAADYRVMRTEACTATRVRGVQSEQLLDLRMQCLDRARVELGGVIEILAAVTKARVASSPALADELPSLAGCANTTALLAPVPPPSAHEAALASELRTELAHASALSDAGRWNQAIGAISVIAERARTLAHAPTRAAALYKLGAAQTGGGDNLAAEHSLREAFTAAEVGHDDLLAAQAAIELVWVLGQTRSRVKDASEWAFHAQTLLERAGGNDELAARLANNQGNIAFAESDYSGARKFYEQALVIRERFNGPDHRATAATAANVARALIGEGDNARAADLVTRSIAGLEHALGPNHPDVGLAYNLLGSVRNNQGDFAGALAAFDRALAISEAILGHDHPQVGQALINRGYALVSLGRTQEAMTALSRAVAIFERDGGDRDMLVAALFGEGDAESSREQLHEALATYKRALAVATAIDPGNENTAAALTSVADVELQLGHGTEALAGYRRALAIRERLTGADYWENAYAHAGIGDASLALGKVADAVAAYRKAVALLDSYDGDPVTRAKTRFSLAKALDRAHRDPREVSELLAASERELAEAGDAGAKPLEELRSWRARRARR